MYNEIMFTRLNSNKIDLKFHVKVELKKNYI